MPELRLGDHVQRLNDSDLTVLYYTSSKEPEDFEARARRWLLDVAGHLPIVSVSQKPLDLGTNICVGDVGASYANEFRQIEIGAEAVKTTWIAVAEADFLYPPAYFQVPPNTGSEIYRYTNLWVLWAQTRRYGTKFARKNYSEGAQIITKRFLLKRIKRVMDKFPRWSQPGDPVPGEIYRKRKWFTFEDPEQPVIAIKSGLSMSLTTGTVRFEPRRDELPYWGSCVALREELFG